MYKLVDTLIAIKGSAYPYIAEKKEALKEQIMLEEERFFKTIFSGIELFNSELANTKDIFSGEVAFKLYDTYGFPLDLTEDMLREKNLKLDSDTFDALMKAQRERAKAAWKGSGDAAIHGDFKALLEQHGENEFIGYETQTAKAKVLALLSEEFTQVDALHAEQIGWVLLDKSPFYAESGGQCGDTGELNGFAHVQDTKKFHGLNLLHVRVTNTLNVGAEVEASVDSAQLEIMKHHSATHLLHAALYETLGDHIAQAGSANDASRLRFDFSHPKAMSEAEVKEVEESVNAAIARAITRKTEVMSIEDAKNSGAKAQFGEKYGESVRVVSFDDFSVEFCGGLHVNNTADIGMFVITKESGVSAGVRRIEAVCGKSAYNYFKTQREELNKAAEVLKNRDVVTGIEKLKEQIKTLKAEVIEAQNASKESLDAEVINGVSVIVEEISAGDVKSRIDEIKNAHESVAAMLFQVKGDKVIIACGVKNASVKAGDWIKNIAPILGGGGGGRPDFAQAGGKDASKLPEAKTASLEYLKAQLA